MTLPISLIIHHIKFRHHGNLRSNTLEKMGYGLLTCPMLQQIVKSVCVLIVYVLIARSDITIWELCL